MLQVHIFSSLLSLEFFLQFSGERGTPLQQHRLQLYFGERANRRLSDRLLQRRLLEDHRLLTRRDYAKTLRVRAVSHFISSEIEYDGGFFPASHLCTVITAIR